MSKDKYQFKNSNGKEFTEDESVKKEIITPLILDENLIKKDHIFKEQPRLYAAIAKNELKEITAIINKLNDISVKWYQEEQPFILFLPSILCEKYKVGDAEMTPTEYAHHLGFDHICKLLSGEYHELGL